MTSVPQRYYSATSRSVCVLSITESTTNLTHTSNLHGERVYIVYYSHNLVYVIYNIYNYST